MYFSKNIVFLLLLLTSSLVFQAPNISVHALVSTMDQDVTEEIFSSAEPKADLERDFSKPSLHDIVYSDTEIKKLADISIKDTIQVNDVIFSVSDPYVSPIGLTIDVIVSGDIQPNGVIIADLRDSEDNTIYGIGTPEILFNNKIRYNLLFTSFTPNNLDYILSLNLYTIITSDFSKHLFAQTQMTISFKDVAFNLDPLEFNNLLMVLYDFDNDGFDDSYKLTGTVSSSNSLIYNYNGLILDKSFSGILTTSETFDFTTSNTLIFEIYLPVPLQYMDPEAYYGILYELVSYTSDGNIIASYPSNSGLYLAKTSLNHDDIIQQNFSLSHIARFDDISNEIIIEINIVFPKAGLYYFLYTNYLELIPSSYHNTNSFSEGLASNIESKQISISANSLIDFPDLSTIDILIFLQFYDPTTRGPLKKNMFSSVVTIDQSDIVFTELEFQINRIDSRFYDVNEDDLFNNLILYIYYQSDLDYIDGYVNVYTDDMKFYRNQYINFPWTSFNENILSISIDLTGLYEMNYTNSQLYFDVTYDLQREVLDQEVYYILPYDYQNYDTHVHYGSISFSSDEFTPQPTLIVSVDDIGYDVDADGIIDGIRFFIWFEMAYSQNSQFILVFENGQRIYSSDYWTVGLHVTEISVSMSTFSITGNKSINYDIEHSQNYESSVKIYSGSTNYYEFNGTYESSFSKLSISYDHQYYNNKYDSIIVEYSYTGSAGVEPGYEVFFSSGFDQYVSFLSEQSSVYDQYSDTTTFTLIITDLSKLISNLVNDSLRLSLYNYIYGNGFYSSAYLTSDLFIFNFGDFANPRYSLLPNMPIKVEKNTEIEESDFFTFSLPILAINDGLGGNFWLDIDFHIWAVYDNLADNYHYEYISLTDNYGNIGSPYKVIYARFEMHSGNFDLTNFNGYFTGLGLDIYLQSDDYLLNSQNYIGYRLDTIFYMYSEGDVEEPITSGGVVITLGDGEITTIYDDGTEVAFLPLSSLFILGILFLPILQSLKRKRDKI